MTDHFAEAERHIKIAASYDTDLDAEGLHLRYAQVHATLADRCPDPDAHQAEDGTERSNLREQLIGAFGLDEDGSDDEIVHTVQMRLGSVVLRAHTAGREVDRLRAELTEARAARPAPIRPEVVAVVEAAQEWAVWIHDGKGKPVDPAALYDAVRALPEDWRDRAAAVPAVLDEAGIERAARVAAKQRGVNGKAYDSLPGFVKLRNIERARAVVRAYLGDTDTGPVTE